METFGPFTAFVAQLVSQMRRESKAHTLVVWMFKHTAVRDIYSMNQIGYVPYFFSPYSTDVFESPRDVLIANFHIPEWLDLPIGCTSLLLLLNGANVKKRYPT